MSQLQIWDSAIPTLVTAVGWYGEQPENTVLPVRHEYEEADIHRHLAAFLHKPEETWKAGLSGKKLLTERHDPGNYAEEICKIVTSSKTLAAQRAAAISAARVAQTVPGWLGQDQFQRWSKRIAQRIAETYLEETID